MAKRTRHTYTLEEKERGLTALVLAAGSAKKATAMLKDAGYRVPDATLRVWRSEDPKRYDELRERLVPQVETMIAQQAEDIALMASERERKVLEAFTDEAIAGMEPKDLANALKGIATAKALQVDKIQGPLRGRPQIVEHRHDANDLLNKLATRIGNVIDSTAEDLPDVTLMPAIAPASAPASN